MNIGILTACTKHNPFTTNGKCDFLEPGSQNHLKYCLKHNYSYVVEYVDNIVLRGMHPTWVKVFALKKYLNNFDYCVWIDSDCVFAQNNIKIEDFVKNSDIDLFIPKGDVSNGYVTTEVSTGFMILKNCQWSKDLLNTLLNYSEYFEPEKGYHEQSALSQILKQNLYFENCENLKSGSTEDLKTFYFEKNLCVMPYRYHQIDPNAPMSYLFHAGGSSKNKKQNLINFLNEQ